MHNVNEYRTNIYSFINCKGSLMVTACDRFAYIAQVELIGPPRIQHGVVLEAFITIETLAIVSGGVNVGLSAGGHKLMGRGLKTIPLVLVLVLECLLIQTPTQAYPLPP